MSSKDIDPKERKDVYDLVWDRDAPDTVHQSMREALVDHAIEITHENGTYEGTVKAEAETVLDFLSLEVQMALCGEDFDTDDV